ncbi:MAG TPA: hypothetical protein VFI60_05800 [Candidatus Acidoferrum sp.]|nr:hypothetical protein [Candidatus Acidoferrum sp.]
MTTKKRSKKDCYLLVPLGIHKPTPFIRSVYLFGASAPLTFQEAQIEKRNWREAVIVQIKSGTITVARGEENDDADDTSTGN